MSEVVKIIFDSRDLLLGHSFADMCRAKLRGMDFDSSTRFELYGDHGHMILPLPRESVAIFGAVALDIICCREPSWPRSGNVTNETILSVND